MSINFTCPHCGHNSLIDDQFAGRSGPCVQCGQPITIPGSSAPPPPKPESGASGSGSARTTLIVVGAVGCLLVGGVVVIAALVAILLPAVGAAREAARRSTCQNNLRQIGLALHQYESQYGTLPPAYIADEDGNPMHSWRVLILPFLGEDHIYEQYDFSQPWDSEQNLAVAALMPPVYACPSDPAAAIGQETSYMVIVGPQTAFPGSESVSLDDIHDGASRTLLVVEAAGSAVGWTQPIDLPAESMSWQINGPAGKSIASHHAGQVANVVFADVHVASLGPETPPEDVRTLSTIAGGEEVGHFAP